MKEIGSKAISCIVRYKDESGRESFFSDSLSIEKDIGEYSPAGFFELAVSKYGGYDLIAIEFSRTVMSALYSLVEKYDSGDPYTLSHCSNYKDEETGFSWRVVNSEGRNYGVDISFSFNGTEIRSNNNIT